jgi:hypothetical protein
MAQASKAIAPKDNNGPFGQRIGVSVGGGTNWALRVGSYMTARNNPSDWIRYSLVVLNWYIPFFRDSNRHSHQLSQERQRKLWLEPTVCQDHY